MEMCCQWSQVPPVLTPDDDKGGSKRFCKAWIGRDFANKKKVIGVSASVKLLGQKDSSGRSLAACGSDTLEKLGQRVTCVSKCMEQVKKGFESDEERAKFCGIEGNKYVIPEEIGWDKARC